MTDLEKINRTYADIKINDTINGEGISVSFWASGCPHHCKGCHNPTTWNPSSGKLFTQESMDKILNNIEKNGVVRNFSILGGEPLAEYNVELVSYILREVRNRYPDIKVFMWTGYKYHSIKHLDCVANVDILIDGLFVEEEKDLMLKHRGSRNQNVVDVQKSRQTGLVHLIQE